MDHGWTTADLCDTWGDAVRVAGPGYLHLGLRTRFCGPAHTVRCHEDNSRVGEALRGPGHGRVLVVDGGGSLRRALVGDQLAAAGAANGWAGVIVHGAIRDARIVGRTELGVLALGTVPRKTEKRGAGEAGVVLALSGVTVAPGEWVYADEDGWIVAAERLHPV